MLGPAPRGRVTRFAAALLLACAPLVGCGTSAIPLPSDAQVAVAQRRDPAATRSSLEEGRRLLIERCSGCHATPTPASRAPEDWPAEVAAMAPRARLDDHARARIEAYLVSAASAR